MKNKKIIFLVTTVCCLVVAFACFCGFTNASGSFYPIYLVFDSSVDITSVVDYYDVQVYRGPFGARWPVQTNTAGVSFTKLTLGAYGTGVDSMFINVDETLNAIRIRVPLGSQSASFFVYLSCNDITYKVFYFQDLQVYSSDGTNVTESISNDFGLYTNVAKVGTMYSTSTDTRYFGYTVINCKVVDPSEMGVSQDVYNALQSQYNTLQGNYNTLQSQYNALENQYDIIWQQYLDKETEYNDLVTDFDTLQGDYNVLQTQYDSVSSQLENAFNSNAQLRNELDSYKSGEYGLGFVGTAFEKVGDILQIEILPNITIGTIVAVPLILGVVFLVLRLVRGE